MKTGENELTGTIPTEIGLMTSLTFLYLGECQQETVVHCSEMVIVMTVKHMKSDCVLIDPNLLF